MKDPPDKPLAIVSTVWRALAGPSFSVRVTVPEASDQETLNALPAVMPAKDGFVN